MHQARHISLILLVLIPLLSSCRREYHGEGPVVMHLRDVDEIRRLSVNMPVTVRVTDTSESYCRVFAQQNILEAIQTKQSGKTLYINCRGDLYTSQPVEIEVGLVRPEGIEINGSGVVLCSGTFKGDKLSFEVNGSGKLVCDAVSLKLRSYVSGSGVMDLSGSTRDHRIEISGSGMVNALNLAASETHADVSGSGVASVWSAESLDVSISGSGEIHYKGSPKLSKSIAGSGKVVPVH